MRPVDTLIVATSAIQDAPKKKRKSPADLRRDAARAQKLIEKRLTERSEAWADGGRSEFLVIRQDGDETPGKGDDGYLHHETASSLKGLNVTKRHAMHGVRVGGQDA